MLRILIHTAVVLACFALFLVFGWLWSPGQWLDSWRDVLGRD